MRRFLRVLVLIPVVVSAVTVLLYAGIDLYGHKQQRQRADVICVFGAAVWGQLPSPELEARLVWAARLYRDGIAPVLFLSGGPTGTAMTEADVMGTVAEGAGVPRSALVFDNGGTTTARTLSNLKRYMQGNGLTTCLMVSSPFHMARIMLLARLNHMVALTCPPVTTPVSSSNPERARAIVREELALLKDVLVFVLAPD
ncbi:MAG: YdcF family protein [Candidatus Cryosericum sp.]